MNQLKQLEKILGHQDKRKVTGVTKAYTFIMSHPESLEDLIQCIFHTDEAISMRASDALEKVSLSHPNLVQAFKAKLLQVPRKCKAKEALWHWCQVAPRLELTEKQAENAYQHMTHFLDHESSILRTFALQGMVDLASTYPNFIEDSYDQVYHALQQGSKAMKARAKQLLVQLKKIEELNLKPKLALHRSIAQCKACPDLPLGPRPVVRFSTKSKILIVGQAPGVRVHKTGIPWNDPSGERLRSWLNVGRQEFYNVNSFALVPMGFCYPGTKNGGDLPPRSECADLWQRKVRQSLKNVQLTLIIGRYAMDHYLPGPETLTDKVLSWQKTLPEFLPLPHPSPRNNRWLKKNPWFEEELVPTLQDLVQEIL